MKKLIAMFLALAMIPALLSFAGAESADGPRTERVGMLSLLQQSEEETVNCIKTVILVADQVKEQGYSENLLPAIGDSIDTAVVFQPVYYDTLDALIMGLTAGEVEIMNIYSTTAAYLCARNDDLVQTTVFKPLDDNADIFIRRAYTGLLCNDFAFMMTEGNEALRDEFNTAIAGIREDGTLEKLIEEHIEAAVAGKNINPVEMPEIDGAETVRVAVTGSLPPMDYVAADGTPAGFNTALLAEISRRINKNIELVQVDCMGRAAALASNRVDAVFWTRTNSESNRIAEMTEEEKKNLMQEVGNQLTEEQRDIVEQGRQLVDFADFGRADMPEGTVITDAYFSDMLVPVALKSFVEFLQSMSAAK